MPAPALLSLLPMLSQQMNQKKQNFMNMAYDQFTNWQERRYNDKMYSRQRADALADWAMQNEYNSPANQMKRYQEAGLNPNLIYGQTNMADAVRTSSVQAYNPKQSPLRYETDFMSYFDAEIKQAQTDNVKAAVEVARQEVALKAAQTAGVIASSAKTEQDTAQGKFNLEQAKALQGTVLETAKQNLEKIKSDIKINLNEDERRAAMNAQSIAEGVQRVLLLKKQQAKTEAEKRQIEQAIKNASTDQQLKELDLNLKKIGVQPGDNMIFRIIAQWLEQSGMADKYKNILKFPPGR